MRYVVFVYPFHLAAPIYTDFRLIAFLLGFYRRLFYPEVHIFDRDTDEHIYGTYGAGKHRQKTMRPDSPGFVGGHPAFDK